MRTDDSLQSGVDLCEQTADPVRCRCRLLRQFIDVATQHGQFGHVLIGYPSAPQSVGHCPGGFSDDRGIAGTRFCLTWA